MKVTEEHIQLLAAMANLLTLEENFGFVPEFNAKRPFGNSMRAIVAADATEVMTEGAQDGFDLMVNIPHSKRMPDGTLVPCTLLEWAEWVEAPETNNLLARTAVPFGEDGTEAVLVTTKFTG